MTQNQIEALNKVTDLVNIACETLEAVGLNPPFSLCQAQRHCYDALQAGGMPEPEPRQKKVSRRPTPGPAMSISEAMAFERSRVNLVEAVRAESMARARE